MELSFIHHESHTIIYGIGSLIVTITLIALTRNLFCRKPNDDHFNPKRQRYHSRSFADYSRSTNASTNKSRSNYELPRPHSNSMKKSKQSLSITNTTTNNKKDKTTSSMKNSQITNIITNHHPTTTAHTQSSPNTNTSSSSTSTTPNTYTSCPTISSNASSTISIPNKSTIQLSEGKYGTYLCNVTPTPNSSDTPRSISPIPQFTPICDSNQTAETLPSFGDGKQSSNVDTDIDEKYDTDGYDTDNVDTEKESMNHRQLSNGKLPTLSNQYSGNLSDNPTFPRAKSLDNSKPRSSISMSVSMSNFKLPRMGSITSRPTSVLKKVLRRMQYGQYDSKDINLSIRATSLCGCIGFLLSLLILCMYYSFNFDAKWKVNLVYVSILLYIVSKFVISSCSLCRLYFCLINSSLQYSACVYIMSITILILQFLVSISFCICLYMQFWSMLVYFGVAFYIFDVVYSLVLYVLFTKRMLQLFENTSTYIAKSSARAYHEALRSTQSFDYDETGNVSPNLSIKHKKSVEIVTPPSPGNAAGFEFGDNCTDKPDHGGIEYAVTHNLSIQIEQIQDPQQDIHSDNGDRYVLSQSVLKSPTPRMMVAKSYSTDNIDLSTVNSTSHTNHKLNTRSRGTSLSVEPRNNESLSKKELSRIKRELSKIKRERAKNYKKEKWKYYQKQQESGIEYVTRYTVLILIATLSSLSMAGILIYEQHSNFENFMSDKTMEFHVIFVMDVVINCMSIYFYFIFGKWLYHLSCCLCHSFIQSCCVSLCI